MKEITSEKILSQVFNFFRTSSLTKFEAVVLSLQILGWAKMSHSGKLPGDFNIQKRAYDNPEWIRRVWDELSNRSKILKIAYSKLKMPSKSDLNEAIERCNHFAKIGMLELFDPSDYFFNLIGKEAGTYSLPTELADIMIALARIDAETNIYTPWDNSIQLAVRAAKLGATSYIETVHEPLLPALISLFVDGEIEIVHNDPIREPSAVDEGKLRQFDTCLAFPPIGIRYGREVIDRDFFGRFKEKTTSGTLLAIRHIIAQTCGRAIIALPNNILFSPDYKDLRKELVERGFIESIIAMPKGLFTHITISFALLVLSISEPRESIRFVNAENKYSIDPKPKSKAKLTDIEEIVELATGRLADVDSAEIDNKTVSSNGFMLQVNRYVGLESKKEIDLHLKSYQTKLLGEIVDIIRTMPMTSSDDVIDVWEVRADDLPEFAYISQPLKKVSINRATSGKNKSHFLQPFDIVLIIKGSVGKIGIVPKDIPPSNEGGWIIGQSGIILRVKDENILDPRVLAVYLRSSLGQKLLKGIVVKGATIPLIRQQDLMELQVIIPTEEESIKLVNSLEEQAHIQREIEILRARQDSIANRFWKID